MRLARTTYETSRNTYPAADLSFRAGAGELNRLVVEHAAVLPPGKSSTMRGEWTFRDPAAVLVPSGECRAVSEHEVTCTVVNDDGRFVIDLGDANDALEVRAPMGSSGYLPTAMRGGAGDDELTLVEASLEGYGGPGNDTLRGNAIHGDAGNDLLMTVRETATARGGSGDDRIVGSDAFEFFYGGSGDDRVEGGGGGDRIDGGGGRDVLLGGEGDDVIGDGDGRPDTRRRRLPPAPADRDTLDGGPGRDSADWSGSLVPVRVDLRAVASQARRTDDATGFESAGGGRRGDRMIGDAGRNELSGGAGADRLAGLGGNDRLTGGDGRDVLLGGRGRDLVLAAFDRAVDRIVCDRRDRGNADPRDRVGAACRRHVDRFRSATR